MREIIKTLSIPVDGKPRDFRLTKLDAFSGASLLRLMARLPEGGASVEVLLSCLSDADLRSLMTVCLEHAEVMLPAGWMPVNDPGRMELAGAGARYGGLPEADDGGGCVDAGGFFRRGRFEAVGHWRQHELWDGTYTLDDLLDITEMIRVMRENERRAAEAARDCPDS